MYSINYTHQFKKDMRKCAKRGLNIDAITQAISILAATGTLPAEYKPHQLKGDHKGQWECHIEPNWLMVDDNEDTVDMKFSRDMTPDELYDVIAEEIDHIYAVD